MTTIELLRQTGSAEKEHGAERLLSLDVLRGLAVAGMILVNSPGSWQFLYPPFAHAPWHGWTLADIVFPAFLFAVGMSLALGFPHTADARSTARLWLKIARRTMLLVLLGLFLNLLPSIDLAHLRIPGVLQRIGLCYAIAASLCIVTAVPHDNGRMRLNPTFLIGAILALLVGYWALMAFTAVPGFGTGRLDSVGNLAAYVDRAVFGIDHLWRYATTEGVGVTYDPEGLLSTLPATANVLIGVLTGWALKRQPGIRNAALFTLAGLGLLGIGYLFDPVFPINKRIWTSTFALFSSGFSLVVLAILIVAMAWRPLLTATYPLRVLGGNAILAFVLSTVMGAYAQTPFIAAAGTFIGAQQWGFNATSAFVADPYFASFLCALLVLALITALLAPLERHAIHLRL